MQAILDWIVLRINLLLVPFIIESLQIHSDAMPYTISG